MKKKKKWLVILSIVIALLICILIAGYFLINAAFSMFSESFYQSVIDSEDFVQANGGTEHTSGQEPSGESNQNGASAQAEGDFSGDEGIFKKIPYEKI